MEEIEGRLFVDEATVKRLKGEGFRLAEGYEFTDAYYKLPPGAKASSVRARGAGSTKPCIVVSIGREKVKLPCGSLEEGERVLASLGLEKGFTITRVDSGYYEKGGARIFIENILNLGWSIEIEQDSTEAVVAAALSLGFREKDLVWEPLANYYKKHAKAP